ncbi:MAG: (2Fe-2S)-binding protein [Myxococcales bacterium]|nr:(2Fe-2S)-binding protein [Myxococcales bacterium]
MSDRPRLTRRGLLRGFGTATVIAGCATPKAEETTGEVQAPPTDLPADASAIGPGPAPLTLQINGQARALEVAPNTTLLAALRDHLKLTGTKEVCDRGACGACMVLVDGVPLNACMMLAHDAEGRAITTVEGLASAGKLSALQEAFIAHDAAQCGYCTSGMLISASALLRSSAPKDQASITRALAGNLCRCGSYHHIVAAIEDVAGGAKGGA